MGQAKQYDREYKEEALKHRNSNVSHRNMRKHFLVLRTSNVTDADTEGIRGKLYIMSFWGDFLKYSFFSRDNIIFKFLRG